MFSTALARDLKYISNETYLERLASVNTPAPNPWLLDQEGEIYKDSSIEGLAKILGVDDQRLARTLDDYNRAIGSNNLSALNIPRTHKPRPLRAPFYGLRVVPGITFTMGHPGEWTRPSSERRREADSRPLRCWGLHRRADGRLSRRLHRRFDASAGDRNLGRRNCIAVGLGK